MPSFQNHIGILGGTFDPPHLGHEAIARELLERFGFRELWVIPTGRPYLNKNSLTSARIRLEMAEAAFAEIERVKVLDIEVVRAEKESAPTYSWNTVQDLQKRYPKLVMCIGSDQWNNIMNWHRSQDLLRAVPWIVYERKGAPLVSKHTHGLKQGESVTFYPTHAPELSSREIRETIEKTGKIPPEKISRRVKQCLMKHLLYGSQRDKS